MSSSALQAKTQYYMDRLEDAVDFNHRPDGLTTADLISILTEWRTRYHISNVGFDVLVKIV